MPIVCAPPAPSCATGSSSSPGGDKPGETELPMAAELLDEWV
eukprot:COSAG01_NODE_70590_length_258_cov_0.647799_1_plen_41_part_10